MGYQLQRLLPKHYKILDLVLAGWIQRKIADELGLSYVGVSNIVTSRVFQAELARRREEQNQRIDRTESVRQMSVREILEGATVEAAEKQVGLLRSPNVRVQQMAAMDILDRGGCSKTSRSEGKNFAANIVLMPKSVERINQVTREVYGHDFPFEKHVENDSDGTAA